LEIRERLEGDRCTLALEGELDISNASALDRAVTAALGDAPKELVLDVRELTFVDSTGFGSLLAAKDRCRDAGVAIAMTRGQPAVQHIFDVSGVLKRLPFV
jgi:anti-anti-sigma factor